MRSSISDHVFWDVLQNTLKSRVFRTRIPLPSIKYSARTPSCVIYNQRGPVLRNFYFATDVGKSTSRIFDYLKMEPFELYSIFTPPPEFNNVVEGNRASISTDFGLQSTFPPDIALASVDAVMFYVHSHVVLGASHNAFRSLIPSTSSKAHPVIHIPESSTTLDIILHAVYHMPFSRRYSFEDLSTAVNQLRVYGVPPKLYVSQDTHLYKLLLSYAPTLPLKVYTLAAGHKLSDLAVATSSHLLSFNLSNLTEETAEAIGSEYLRRLFFLHMGRLDALKRLLSSPPNSHTPTADCNVKDLTRAWALASAYLAWDLRPDLSTNLLASTLIPLGKDISCNLCKEHLHAHIKELSVQWSHVKCTI